MRSRRDQILSCLYKKYVTQNSAFTAISLAMSVVMTLLSTAGSIIYMCINYVLIDIMYEELERVQYENEI